MDECIIKISRYGVKELIAKPNSCPQIFCKRKHSILQAILQAVFNIAWRHTPETGFGDVAFTNWTAQVKMQKYIFGTHFATCNNLHLLVGVYCLSPVHYFINVAGNKLKFVCLKLRLTHIFDFKWRRGQPCRWLSGTNNWVRAHVGDIIIVWQEPNAIWFPATLTDTDLNIQEIQVRYRTNGNCNIPATES